MDEPLYVTTGGILYWIAIIALVLGLVPAFLLCKKKGRKFAYRFILTLYWCDFALHFLKQLMPGYIDIFPAYLVRSTAENFCALFVIIAPFLLISKNKIAYDYLFYMGILSSLGAYFYPTAPGISDLRTIEGIFETTRYYVCHMPLLYGAVCLVAGGLHKLDYKRFWITPFNIFLACGICFVNSAAMNAIFHNWDWSLLLNRDNGYMNASFELGPGTSFDKSLGFLYPYMINVIQIYYNAQGELCFTPVLWTLPLFYALAPIVFLFLCLPFEHKHIKEDILSSPYRIGPPR